MRRQERRLARTSMHATKKLLERQVQRLKYLIFHTLMPTALTYSSRTACTADSRGGSKNARNPTNVMASSAAVVSSWVFAGGAGVPEVEQLLLVPRSWNALVLASVAEIDSDCRWCCCCRCQSA